MSKNQTNSFYLKDENKVLNAQPKKANASMFMVSSKQQSNGNQQKKLLQLPKIKTEDLDLSLHRKRALSEQKSPRKKLQEKLIPLVRLFDQMDLLRQENGIEPINMIRRSEEDLLAEGGTEEKEFQQLRSIKYDPEMNQLNSEINKMRNQAEDYLREFIREAKNDRFIMKKLEDGITKFQKERILLNDKQGKIGAMKAQERIKQTLYNQQIKIYNDLDKILIYENNTVKAGYLCGVLSKKNDPFKQKVRRDVKPNQLGRLNYIMTTKLQ